MPIQHAIWKIGKNPEPLLPSRFVTEEMLRQMIICDPRIISSEWMLIGREEITSHNGRVDLLAIAPDGSLVLIELKRNRTPREIVAQALDYASWVEQLAPDQIAQIYQRFSKGGNLDMAFKECFGTDLDEDALNQSHQIIIVAAELDAASERIIGYLNERDIAINVIFFQVFQHGNEQLLSRAWLIDPGETQANVITSTKGKREREPWNGEYYVSFGDPSSRSWEEARRYGFISAGGGNWYTQTLKLLVPGDRVWVKIPKTGYVGVGRITETVQPVKEFMIHTETGDRPALEVLMHAERYRQTADDPEKAEYFVRVAWLDTTSESKAIDEVGLFGNQNTVCQPTTPKWRHTVDRLKTHFPNWDQQ